MAIIKIANSSAGKRSSLKAILAYIQDPEKTDSGVLVTAKDCTPKGALAQMMLTKRMFYKTDGRQYVHIIQSFDRDDPLTPLEALEIGRKLLDHFVGYEGVVATHTNTDFLHNHIVLNTVHTQTGQKWQMSKHDLYSLRDASDKLCREKGLHVLGRDRSGWKNYGEHTGFSWKRQLAGDIMDSLRTATSRAEFLHDLHARGIQADFGRTNILFATPDGRRCGNGKLMPYGDFSRENIEAHWSYHSRVWEAILNNRGDWEDAVLSFCRTTDDPAETYMRLTMEDSRGRTGKALRDWILIQRSLIEFQLESRKRKRERAHEDKTQSRALANFLRAFEELCALWEQREDQQKMEDLYPDQDDALCEDEDAWEL